jgi:fucose permease
VSELFTIHQFIYLDLSSESSAVKPSISSNNPEVNNDTEELLGNASNHHNNNDVSRQYLVSMVIIGGLMFCFYEGMENINFEYLSTFSFNLKLNLSKQTSALVLSAMSAAYTVGRGVGIVLAIKIEPKYFLYCDIILISIGNAIIYIYANTSETMYITGVVILGLGFSTVFPCIYSYMEQHIRLTNFICGILMVSCASIAIIDPIIVGRYITDYPYILLYVNIGSTVLVMISFLTIEISAIIRRQNMAKKPAPHRPSISGFRP